MASVGLSQDGSAITIRVPLTFRKRGGRKLVIAPQGSDSKSWAPPRTRVDNTMVKAVARAYRWKQLLESGEFATIHDLAAAEKINPSYLSRILRLTLLAPDIVESVLNGQQPAGLQLDVMMAPFPMEWHRQKELFRLII